MAARILDDILNNFLSLDCLLEWLSSKNLPNEENIFFNQYECNQVHFVSYFLVFLREQSSRDFQIYDAETPRKNSHSRRVQNASPAVENCSIQSKLSQNTPVNVSHLDLESLQSFPTLSSSSSILGSEKKNLESTPTDSVHDISNRDISEKKFRRIKLFSETLDGSQRGNNSFKKELDLLDAELKQISENKFAVSTPKPLKNISSPVIDCFNTSGFQPEISPKQETKLKWRNQSSDLSPEINSATPKSRSFSGDSAQRSRDNKMNCRMSLGDFILSDINSDKKEKKGKARKRINPVKVSSSPQISVNSTFSEKTDNSLDSSRSIHLEEKQNSKLDNEKILEDVLRKRLSENKDVTPVRTLSNSSESQAEPELVSCINELKLLSQIYSFLINENYCQNIMIELCFVVSLLVIQDYNKKFSEFDSTLQGKKYFGSIHNCVYFAVETLWLQRNFLLLLNLSALKLLSENDRIDKFNSKLKEFLVNAYSKRQSNEEIKRHNGLMKAGMQGFVSFQYETDNRENFTSDISFSQFRKQRDLFYNILATWEANHLVSGWIFSIGLSSKIRSLLSLSSDPVNLLHLARLFRNQLVMSCCGENQTEEDINEEILQLLPSADPNKILRLRARLTSSPKRQGPCPLPDFTGHQEFYKDFILCTSHSGFHEHLKNSFCDEILRLNDAELTGDMEDDGEHIPPKKTEAAFKNLCLDEQAHDRYLQCTNILRLLAKFLGFVQFLPYRGEKPHSDRILNIHCSVRNSTLPLFDVVSCINSAIKTQKLTLTIPWMVSYLSMIDPYSAHLKFYQSVWRMLILVYKHLKTFRNVKNGFYLKLTLGWIFQLPSFPSEQFYSVVDEYNKSSAESLGISFGEETKVGLDFYDFVEETVLYTVCPFLNEINTILSDNSGCTVKHIRPVTTQENSFTKSQASKQLELRLESNFLHNQSSSTRKTIEFVTERVASIAIKHLIHSVIPVIKERSWTELEASPTNDLKEAEIECDALSEKYYQELLTVCEKENWEISSKRSEVALKALLSNDLQGSVADTCAKIVTRQATEKVQRWMQSHITLAMVKKEFLSVVRKKFSKMSLERSNSALDTSEIYANKSSSGKDSHNLPSKGRGVVHDPKISSASKTLKAIRELIWKIHEEGAHVREVGDIIEGTIKTIGSRNDVIPAGEKALLFLVVDLITIFCVRSEKDVPQEIFKKFFRLLKAIDLENYPQNSLERIVCPRNVALIKNDAKNREKAWQNIANFLMSLMEEEFLTKEQTETQLLSLLRLNWEKDDGMQFSKFISHILERYLKSNTCDKFSLLLEYMLDTINDDEPKSESID